MEKQLEQARRLFWHLMEQRGLLVWNLLLLAGCILVAGCVVWQLRRHPVIKQTIRALLGASSKRMKLRAETEERLQREEGNREKKNLFYRFDLCLYRSGLQKRLPHLTAELYLTILMMTALLLFICLRVLDVQLLLAVMCTAGYVLTVQTILALLVKQKDKLIERNLLQFANLVEGYSRTENDIITIFGKVYPYLEEPLKGMVQECHAEVSASGDIGASLNRLILQTGNVRFRDLITNIELASRHETDYEAVVKSNRALIKRYLAEKEVRLAIIRTARLQIGLLLGLGALLYWIVGHMLGDSLYQILYKSEGGRLLLYLIGAIVLYAVRMLFFMESKE